MTPHAQHVCTVQLTAAGAPYLAFVPASGLRSPYSNSLFTLDLRDGVAPAEAERLAEEINSLLWGVSTTVF